MPHKSPTPPDEGNHNLHLPKPARVVCPNCNAQIGKACTRPTDTGRMPVAWFHLSREAEAQKPT